MILLEIYSFRFLCGSSGSTVCSVIDFLITCNKSMIIIIARTRSINDKSSEIMSSTSEINGVAYI